MIRPCLSFVLLALLALPFQAQSRAKTRRYSKPLPTVQLDLETGAVTRGPTVQQRSAGTVTDFFNNDLSGFIAVDTGSCHCQWFDSGFKGGSGNASDLMSSLSFAYCSSAQDANSGGPGGQVTLGFYEGYTTGGATPSTTVAVFSLMGLPANTGSSSFFGRFQCFFVQVNLATLVCFADGQIGYSWKFVDGTGPGTLAQTWPFLACVASCSGVMDLSPPFQDGYIDQYCPPGFLRSTFSFGTAPGGFSAGIAMEIHEVVDCPATLTSSNGQGINADVLTGSPAQIDRPWSVTLILGEPTHPPAGSAILLFSPVSLATGPRISLLGGPVTELLLSPTSLARPCGTESYAGATTTLCAGTVLPKDPSLVGAAWNVQALAGTPGAGFTLSNSLGGVVGTP